MKKLTEFFAEKNFFSSVLNNLHTFAPLNISALLESNGKDKATLYL